MTRTTTHHITPTSQRWVRAHRFVAVIASFAALSACGESDPGDQPSGPGVVPGASPLAQSAGPGSPDAPPPTIPEDVEEMIDSITQTSLVPVLVQGLVSAGGHTWPIPATFFAQDLTAGDPILVLTDCAVFGLGRGTRDSPTPTVMVGHQATLDRSAGDYVSFAYDGDVLTGGAYSHASGQEWAWSVRDVSVAYYPILDNLLLVDVSWAGDAGENFSAERGSVLGSATCWLAPTQTAERLIDDAEELVEEARRLEAERKAKADEALVWPSRPAQPSREPDSSHVEVIGEMAFERAYYPPEARDDLIEHYTETFGRDPDIQEEAGSQWVHTTPGAPQTLTTVAQRGEVVVVQTSWTAP